MNDERSAPGVPPWVRAIGAAVWVTSPDLGFRYANEEARRLLTEDLEEGKPCHESVAARDLLGGRFCSEDCELFERARRGERIEPARIQVGEEDSARWMLLVVVPIEATEGAGPWLVHIATDIDPAHRSEQYLTRVAFGTTADAPQGRPRAVLGRPSPRELEILDRLSHHEDQRAIAHALHVSYATVRNHVQSLLRKLDAHSIEEAVALHLLRHVPPSRPPGGGGAGGCPSAPRCRLRDLCSARWGGSDRFEPAQ